MVPKRSVFYLAPLVSAALLWGQTASAAVSPLPAQIDPLVAVSAFGTAGSASAVCAGAAQVTAAVPPAGCVLPVPEAAPPPPPPEAAPPPPPLAAPEAFNVLPILLGLAALAAVAAVIASGHSHGNGNLTPVSPA